MANEKFLDSIIPRQKKVKRDERWRFEKESDKFSLSGFKKIILGLIILGIGSLAFAHFSLQKAEIKIWLSTEALILEKEIKAEKEGRINFKTATLPYFVLEIENQASQTFPSSFVFQEKKAEGTIRIYNKYSDGPLILRAQTRFLSDKGKLFRSLERLVIPGRKREEGEIKPGVLDVKVIAAEPGEDYNIGPSKFSLPGLAGTALYTLVWAESTKPMRGGFSGKGKQVLKEDFERAENILTKKLKDDNLKTIEERESQKFIILKGTENHQVVKKGSSNHIGDLVDNFDFLVKLKTSVLALKRESLEELAKHLLKNEIKENKTFWQESLKLFPKIKENKLEKEELILSLRMEIRVYHPLDERALVESLLGKKINEAVFLLQNQFPKSEIKPTPFWLTRIPKDPERVKLEIILQ
jgi:hypothetical protein